MRSSCSIRRTAAAGSLPVISGQSLGRLISPWSASAAIHTSWHFGRPTVERCRHRCSTETPLPINLRRDPEATSFPIYVNFKLSLRLEPLYINTPNASFWFRRWLIAKVYEGAQESLATMEHRAVIQHLPSRSQLGVYIKDLEFGRVDDDPSDVYSVSSLGRALGIVCTQLGKARCVLLLDDAAHAFSPKQQEDFLISSAK